MKKIKLFLLSLYSTLLFLSCSKKNNQEPIQNGMSESIWKAVKSPSILGIRQSYHLLSTDEKQMLWETKLTAILKNDAKKLTSAQKKIVLIFFNMAEKENFKKLISNPSIGEKIVNESLEYYKKHFSSEQLFFLFECSFYENNFSIFKTAEYLNTITTQSPNSVLYVSDCTCYYSVYCETTPHEPGNSCISSNNSCSQVVECGVFGGSNCTGTCQ